MQLLIITGNKPCRWNVRSYFSYWLRKQHPPAVNPMHPAISSRVSSTTYWPGGYGNWMDLWIMKTTTLTCNFLYFTLLHSGSKSESVSHLVRSPSSITLHFTFPHSLRIVFLCRRVQGCGLLWTRRYWWGQMRSTAPKAQRHTKCCWTSALSFPLVSCRNDSFSLCADSLVRLMELPQEPWENLCSPSVCQDPSHRDVDHSQTNLKNRGHTPTENHKNEIQVLSNV